MSRHDAIVIGGGHNGLVAAAYLARAGRRTLVLERRPLIGGAAVTEEVFPGFKFSVFSYVVSLLRPEIIRDLDLPRHGLQILPLESTITPMENGDYLGSWADPDESRRELSSRVCDREQRDSPKENGPLPRSFLIAARCLRGDQLRHEQIVRWGTNREPLPRDLLARSDDEITAGP